MSRKSLALCLTLVAVLSLSALAVAGPGGPGPALTPEQREQAIFLFEEHQKAVIPLHEQLRAKHALLDSALRARPVDEKAVDALTGELGELKARLFAAQVELRKKLAAAGLPDMGARMMDCPGRGPGQGHGMGHGMGHGGGGCPGWGQGDASEAEAPQDLTGMGPGAQPGLEEEFAAFGG
ncbi:periplasmic heavy metal sensor [Desulfocurvus sp.]|jgi:zinc resistance-associated protein|uniref:Spy/CpxP family protein refolding chaperone n=1 Tax=Desulfocurvus sp. TaxID=2871698 RepID=UPI0025C5AD7A|nr:periplasmic heavy metal sensor [Desulfocurvus sp.]MCK9240599.1 periplasmic heavy metal sensor [Desulfocurvus sp.]